MQRLDRIGEMHFRDGVVASLDPYLVRGHQHIGVGMSWRRLESIGSELDQEPERVFEIDRIHEAAILHAAMLDRSLIEALDRLQERDARDGKCE